MVISRDSLRQTSEDVRKSLRLRSHSDENTRCIGGGQMLQGGHHLARSGHRTGKVKRGPISMGVNAGLGVGLYLLESGEPSQNKTIVYPVCVFKNTLLATERKMNQ